MKHEQCHKNIEQDVRRQEKWSYTSPVTNIVILTPSDSVALFKTIIFIRI